MSAKDEKSAGTRNRPNAQFQRGVSRAQQLLIVALVCIVMAGCVSPSVVVVDQKELSSRSLLQPLSWISQNLNHGTVTRISLG